ncbi:FdhD protein [Desulfotomaculum arcticum]|uniref:Protein FdhD n=1 Tax=Desulfotruncus arcticus DSM 17038 TaxID=1121424 RepID=A0A1I2QLY4_9FIRM|nr:formate dehydrogenase accessory sulfurtransferase FdhD [Desulfotruncus arcticus]SFG29615.1 FdhD protein [Desulfotomaculum arcticum] [Desulfotruncus arcticus DSM 17038]
MKAFYKKVNLVLYSNDEMQVVNNVVVKDQPLTIFYNDRELTTLICSPDGYEVLAVGFLLSEGLLQKPSNIKEITCNEAAGVIRVETYLPTPQTESYLRRHMAGYYGDEQATMYFANDVQQLRPVQSECRFKAIHLLNMMRELDDRSDTYRLTGGVHSAALADNGEMLLMYEDIGRHNAVDKVLGHVFLNEITTGDKCLLLSGRVSSEILIKAARSNIPVVVSRAAPTELAVELSDQLGITVVGFARGLQLSIYSHVERILA